MLVCLDLKLGNTQKTALTPLFTKDISPLTKEISIKQFPKMGHLTGCMESMMPYETKLA